MAKEYGYRNLIVWQQAQELALAIMQVVQVVPQSWANAVLVRQIVSAATSIGANIAEGHGRYALGAHRNHLSIARGSAAETDSWLDLFRRNGWITAAEEAGLHAACNQIMAILTSKMRELERLTTEAPSLRETATLYEIEPHELAPQWPFSEDDYCID